MFQKLIDNPETIIAFFALVTSVVSIYYTYHSLKTQKEYNLMSFRPIGIISAGDFANDIFVSIRNNGTGPLIILNFKVSKSKLESTHLIAILPDNLKSIDWTDFVSDDILMDGLVIKSGEERYLIRLNIDNPTSHNTTDTIKKELRNSLKDLTITMTYTDIHEKQKFKTHRKLDWFGRHIE